MLSINFNFRLNNYSHFLDFLSTQLFEIKAINKYNLLQSKFFNRRTSYCNLLKEKSYLNFKVQQNSVNGPIYENCN